MRELIEFGCNDCNGFFRVNLNLAIAGKFLFECPECGRKHPREVTKAEAKAHSSTSREALLKERTYHDGEGKRIKRSFSEGDGEVIKVPKAAYSKKSKLEQIERPGHLTRAWARLIGDKET